MGLGVVEGVGGGVVTANGVAIVVLAMKPEERGRGLGLQSAAQAIGLGAGPALGGLILDTLGWHWAFWINVPFGLAGAVLGWLVIPQTRNLGTRGRFAWQAPPPIPPPPPPPLPPPTQ